MNKGVKDRHPAEEVERQQREKRGEGREARQETGRERQFVSDRGQGPMCLIARGTGSGYMRHESAASAGATKVEKKRQGSAGALPDNSGRGASGMCSDKESGCTDYVVMLCWSLDEARLSGHSYPGVPGGSVTDGQHRASGFIA